ncbi:MAG: IclR family transcriptional regulator [Acidovorax sp.]
MNTPADKPPDTAGVTLTLERGLHLLRAFRAERKPLTNADLMRRTGLSRSSVSRLVCTLINLGYLRRAAGGKGLELAMGGLDIGMAYVHANPVTQRVHPLMQSLADQLNVNVALAVPDGLDMLYIACRTSAQLATLRLDVGSLLPMGATAIGRAWLWALPPPQRQDYLQAIARQAGAQAPAVVQRIGETFNELDRHGVCIVMGEYQHNAYGIALPLRVGSGGTLMALNCGAVGQEREPAAIRDRMGAELKRLAREIQELLRDVDAEP